MVIALSLLYLLFQYVPVNNHFPGRILIFCLSRAHKLVSPFLTENKAFLLQVSAVTRPRLLQGICQKSSQIWDKVLTGQPITIKWPLLIWEGEDYLIPVANIISSLFSPHMQ